jgi:general secretion pathway protein F
MAVFSYIGFSSDGSRVGGETRANSIDDALNTISEMGLTPVEVVPFQERVPWWSRDISISSKTGAKQSADTANFLFSMATLLQAKIPFVNVLRYCEQQASSRRFSRALSRIRMAIEDGETLEASLANEPDLLPPFVTNLLAIGERSNCLPQTSLAAAEFLRVKEERRRQIKSSLIYPMILGVMSLMVLSLLVFFLAPSLEPAFTAANSSPPRMIALLLGLRGFVLNSWPLMIVLFAAVTLAILVLKARLRRLIAPALLRAPWIGPQLRRVETQRMCNMLAISLSSGATLTEALKQSQAATSHPAYTEFLEMVNDKIASGDAFSASFRDAALLDPVVEPLISAADTSDRLAEVLALVSKTLAKQTETAIAKGVQIITPAITLLIGLAVGSLIISTISSVMALNDLAF